MDYLGEKARRVLKGILLLFFLLSLRAWQLSVVEKELYQRKALAPRKRFMIEKPQRGEIHDRDGKPLAINRMMYQASIYYGEILQIPRVRWISQKTAGKKRIYPRKTYIETLAKQLAEVLDLPWRRIEDEIHAKASLFPHSPYVLQKNLSEKQYYQLRMMQRDLPGLTPEITSERHYPHGKVACAILGHMGAIAPSFFKKIQKEQQEEKDLLANAQEGACVDLPPGIASLAALEKRQQEREKRGYASRDFVGKIGIEKQFEKDLRGFIGKKTYEVGAKGNFLQEIASEPSLPGKNLTLNISLPLQLYAEELLAEDEKTRDGRSYVQKQKRLLQKQPWIKGGAIVALDPNTGEILALASYPRFDPNDYIRSQNVFSSSEKRKNLHTWLESDLHLSHIWEGKKQLVRERFHKERGFYEETMTFSWEQFLSLILDGSVKEAALSLTSVKDAIALQEDAAALLFHSGEKTMGDLFAVLYPQNAAESSVNDAVSPLFLKKAVHFREKWSFWDKVFDYRDKLFLLDLARLCVHSPSFSNELICSIGNMTLSNYFALWQEEKQLEAALKKEAKALFHEITFLPWRQKQGKTFLRKRRLEEKQQKRSPKPYIDLLEEKEAALFADFWNKVRLPLIASYVQETPLQEEELHPYCSYLLWLKKQDPYFSLFLSLRKIGKKLPFPLFKECLRTFRSYHDLTRPLYAQSAHVRGKKGAKQEKHLASAFYPFTGFGFTRSYAYRENLTLGSIFKIVVSYSALCKKMRERPTDFSSMSPLTITDQIRYIQTAQKKSAMIVGYDASKKPLTRYYQGGRLPKSHKNGIGKVDLMGALEQSSNPYFALLAKKYLDSPLDLLCASRALSFGEKTGIELPGEIRGHLPDDLRANTTGLYSFAIGQHTLSVSALQTACMFGAFANGEVLQPRIVRKLGDQPYGGKHCKQKLFLPPIVKQYLYTALGKVVGSKKGSARGEVIKGFRKEPLLKKRYKESSSSLIGKTSTAEVSHFSSVHPSAKPEIYKDIWFGCLSFEETGEQWEKPELVVIVFLRFGDAGKEGVPLAFKMVEKYRELYPKTGTSSSEKRH